MQWRIKAKKIIDNLPDLEKILLEHRQVVDKQDFFNPLHPEQIKVAEAGIDLKQFNKAISRIKQAIAKKEEVLIFGDYDADGICSTAIIWETLYKLGMKAQVFIPHRQKHGYGISLTALAEIQKQKKVPQLIITVDNGIVAHKALKEAKKKQIDVIVTDHHQADKKKPAAIAVVQTTQLAGAGVAWFLAKALLGKQANELLDLVALATIADQVPLLNFNRCLVVAGLKILAQNKRLGLKKLIQIANLDLTKLTAYSIAFVLAPRINAMGRLGHGLDALRLLCTRNSIRASKLAVLLQTTNQQRQNITAKALEDAKQQVTKKDDDKIFLLYQANYHLGVVGLIAGKLVEQLAKPVLVMSKQGDLIKGSARSVNGIDITKFLRQFEADFEELGGHAMAAGFSFLADKKETLFKKLIVAANNQFADKFLVNYLDLEAIIDYSLVDYPLLNSIDKLRPFGQQNQEPFFVLRKLKLTNLFFMGNNKQHVKLTFIHEKYSKQILSAVAWNYAKQAKQLTLNKEYDLAVSLQENNWNGRTNIQAVLKDLKLSGVSAE